MERLGVQSAGGLCERRIRHGSAITQTGGVRRVPLTCHAGSAALLRCLQLFAETVRVRYADQHLRCSAVQDRMDRYKLEAAMTPRITRRHALAAPLALAGCASANPYFGSTKPPSSQYLVH